MKNKPLKLKTLIENFGKEDDKELQKFNPEQKKKVLEMVKKYKQFGKHLVRQKSLQSISEEISEIIKHAEHLMISETGSWFDKQTVSKNAKELKKCSEDFSKIASEASLLEQRMSACYEDAGHLLSRYFSLDEGLGNIDNL